jgi:excisionase family DNA binding protein
MASSSEGQVTVSILQACVVAGVSRRTIYNWLHAGKLVWVRTAGGAIRIVRASLFRPGGTTR